MPLNYHLSSLSHPSIRPPTHLPTPSFVHHLSSLLPVYPSDTGLTFYLVPTYSSLTGHSEQWASHSPWRMLCPNTRVEVEKVHKPIEGPPMRISATES